MNGFITGTIVAAYLSLFVELLFLHVPSVASSMQIFSPTKEIVTGYSLRYRRIFALSRFARVLLFIFPLGVIYAVFLFPLLVIAYQANPLADYAFVPGLAAQAIGLVMLFLGRVFTMWSVLTMRSGNRQQNESRSLYIDGPFRWSRNPGLLGMYMLVIGLWLNMPSAAMAVGILIYVMYMDFKVRMEEDFLLNRFGQPYADYCDRTRRYL